MSVWESVLRPLLFCLDAEIAHEVGLWALGLLDLSPSSARALRGLAHAERPLLRTTICGLDFPNPVGLAAGLDKNGEALIGLFALGFGSLEVGTVTPRPQPGNEKPRIFRVPAHSALINRMGFNNAGAAAMAARLRELDWRPAPVGVNLGKNKDTPLEEATEDYVACARTLAHLADYVAINLSSPNTPGLRQLQEPHMLEALLQRVRLEVGTRPLFLKIAPDLGDEAIDAVVDVALSCGLNGIICSNTTIARPIDDPLAQESGGLSGRPLAARSTEVVRRAFRRADGALTIVGVGGIFNADDAWEKICAGAALVQLYSGFIYGGPGVVYRVLDGLELKLSSLGVDSINRVVGRDC